MPTWTQSEITALRAAVASGVLSVRYADRTVTYHSLAEMRDLLADMERATARASGSPSFSVVTTHKGL